MLRVLDRVDEEMPSVYETLFRPAADWADRQPLTAKGLVPNVVPPLHLTETCPSLRDLYMAGGASLARPRSLGPRVQSHSGARLNSDQIPCLCPLRVQNSSGQKASPPSMCTPSEAALARTRTTWL